MKGTLTLATLLTVALSSHLARACLPIYLVLSELFLTSDLPLEKTLNSYEASNNTVESFKLLHQCYKTTTLSEKILDTLLMVKIIATPECIKHELSIG
ncbi:secretoglobin family 2B member 24-like [Dromiciops gliroides]|uniref:secretoglobin family 2B member 24-like n=1 Tax=Dromiciops gliroides TaxID=33562 RepID=UPI001CC5FD93|nr:secretoglobin family 2B member 24-like [Dromiciops gliroides]